MTACDSGDRLAVLEAVELVSAEYPDGRLLDGCPALPRAVTDLRYGLYGVPCHPRPALPDDELLGGCLERYLNGFGPDVLRLYAVAVSAAVPVDISRRGSDVRGFAAALIELRAALWTPSGLDEAQADGDHERVRLLNMRGALERFSEEQGVGRLEHIVWMAARNGQNPYRYLHQLLGEGLQHGVDPLDIFCLRQARGLERNRWRDDRRRESA